ncbi:NADH-ubiquinone oxidoreductase chain 6 [Pongo abelii]|uniref:NADH-ubiquinone oxidoreductase chain 6 n=1 Tax=Pongo abelii TaxID=9601 RepID=UPI0030065823
MTYALFLLSVILVMGFVGFSSKPSPIYGGLVLIISGVVGCAIILNCGGRWGMMVVFGYTTAMAIGECPEAWGSGVEVLVSVLVGLAMEVGLVLWVKEYDGVVVVVNFNSVGSWVIYEGEGPGLIREDPIGAGALYDYGR